MTQAIDNPFIREAMKNEGGHCQEERIAVCEAHITMEAETTDEWKHSLTPEILWTPFGVIDRNPFSAIYYGHCTDTSRTPFRHSMYLDIFFLNSETSFLNLYSPILAWHERFVLHSVSDGAVNIESLGAWDWFPRNSLDLREVLPVPSLSL